MNATTSVHPTVDSFDVRDGELLVNGITLDELAARAGSTPFFVYDRSKIIERVDDVAHAMPGDIYLSYAVKANPMPALLGRMRYSVDCMDVASAGEMILALNSGMPPEQISFAGPAKTDAELRQAVAAGVTIELESVNESYRAALAGIILGIRPRVAIRVNPDFSVKGSGMRMGGGSQQFGVDSEDVPTLIKSILDEDRMDFLGLHIFAGSQNLNASTIIEAQANTVALAMNIANKANVELKYLNIGGGFGIPYGEKDKPLDIQAIGGALDGALDLFRVAHRDAKIVLELGRYLVGEAGIYVTRVVDKKVSRGKTFLTVDGGMHHQLAASGNLGQVIRRNYPVAIGNRFKQEPAETVSVVGSLCTPLDLLGNDVQLPVTHLGDLVVVFQAGAYGLSASPTGFLGHALPVELLV